MLKKANQVENFFEPDRNYGEKTFEEEKESIKQELTKVI